MRKRYRAAALFGIWMAVGVLSTETFAQENADAVYAATITAEHVNINKSMESEDVLSEAVKGDAYEILEDLGNGWMKVRVADAEGYLPVSENASVEQVSDEEISAIRGEAAEQAQEEASALKEALRSQVVDFALQFVGGKYKSGGLDPRTGVDCSGFTRYVMQNCAGISLVHSSAGQASQGIAIPASQIRPGDLVFYGSGKINHVAIYIGDGMIVHASTPKGGIKKSRWNYETPVRIINVLG